MTTTLQLSSSSTDTQVRRNLSHLSLGVAKAKKIVVVTGAGISCSCGIPDFRSSDGLYNLVKQQYPDVVLKGRDLFDASLFRDPTSTSVFYTFISKLKQSTDAVQPSPTHHFLKTLDLKGKLLRSYTQNIDGLEERVGLLGSASEEAKSNGKGKGKLKTKEVKNVQLHGDIRRLKCTFCSATFDFSDEYMATFLEGEALDCPECLSRSDARVARAARALKVGKLRPAIVLYDEPHPLGDDIGLIETADLARKPDLLIIMGTSLKVHGLKKLVKEFSKAVHASAPSSSSPTTPSKHFEALSLTASPKPGGAKNSMKGKVIFVNKTAPSSEWAGVIDYHVEGETDEWVARVLEDWKRMRPQDWEMQTTLDGPDKENGFKTVKNITAAKKVGKGSKKGRENVPPPSPFNPPADNSGTAPISELRPPLSPSKRPNNSCHYSKLESSPTKKQSPTKNSSFSAVREDVKAEERGLLFDSKITNRLEPVVEIPTKTARKTRTETRKVAKRASKAVLPVVDLVFS